MRTNSGEGRREGLREGGREGGAFSLLKTNPDLWTQVTVMHG